jgi:CRISPR-associated protein Cas2
MNILVAYDIADPKRLAKVARTLKHFGDRLQKSLFYLEIDNAQLEAIKEKLDGIIDFEEDAVAYIEQCGMCKKNMECRGKKPVVIDKEESDFFIV